MSSESEPINVKVSSGGQIYNDLGIWNQFLNGNTIMTIGLIIIIIIMSLIKVGSTFHVMAGSFYWE